MSEHHTGITEKYETFGGVKFKKAHTVRSLKSAHEWLKKYEKQGFHVRVEKEGPGYYNVYRRRK